MQARYGENTHAACIPSTVEIRGHILIVPCLSPGKKKSAGDKHACGNLLAVRKVFVPESFALLNQSWYHIENKW